MREEACFLEHHADLAPGGREVLPRGGVEKNAAVEEDSAFARAREPCDHRHDRRLACAGAAEERRDARPGLECGVERERAAPLFQLDREAQGVTRLRRMRCASTSERIKAESEMTIETTDRRIAAASAPGICRAV